MAKTKSKLPYLLTLLAMILAVGVVVWAMQMANSRQDTPPPKEIVAKNGQKFLMDTFVKQTTYDKSEDAEQKLEQVFDMLTEFEKKVSMHIPSSEISKINAGAGVSVIKVSPEVYDLVKRSRELSIKSKGKFDITIGPLVKAWGITTESPRVPDEEEIQKLVKRVGASKITLHDKNVTLYLSDPYMEIDLGGVAKGYACDLVRKKYKELGLSDGMLSLGGNIYSFGRKADGTAYTIGLRDPYGAAESVYGTIAAPDKVIATTGGYERYFEQDGKKYIHVLDPKTGYPVESDLAAVTVISEDGLLADYLSTTLFAAGKQALLENIENEKFDVIAVDTERNVYCSEGIQASFVLTNKTDYRLAE